MTVKDLKEKLSEFDDNLIVCVMTNMGGYFLVRNVSQGVNELDGCLFLDDYEEDD